MNWNPSSKSKEYFNVAKSFLYTFRLALYEAVHSTYLLNRMGGEGFLFQTTLSFCVGVVHYLNVFCRKSEVCQLQTAKVVIWTINSNSILLYCTSQILFCILRIRVFLIKSEKNFQVVIDMYIGVYISFNAV